MESRQLEAGSSVPALEIVGVSKRFGQIRALNRVSLEVPRGSVVGLLGPNGAGKTTLMKAMLGLVLVDEGQVLVGGELLHLGDIPAIGALVDRPAFYPYLSGAANVTAVVVARGLAAGAVRNHVAELLELTGLTWAASRRAGTYSTGMRQRLGVACALVGNPSTIVLDEPGSGLDPEGTAEIRTLIRVLAGRGTTVLVSSHLLGEMEQVCDRIAIMTRGQIAAVGPIEDLLGQRIGWELRFADEAAAAAARAVLSPAFAVESKDHASLELVPKDGLDDTSPLALLAAEGIFPIEVRETGRSLEDAYFALTAESDAGPSAA